ncbi:hypothetical protein GETHPA_02560 [Geothrix rubra]|uniref:Uncharacterized protein n=1 Tax=Geothrix rubra TaxID=2927977 RepID=A0ABQ5Q242_9BACT|nr:hypothetical protein [Geothrix rubra]GLH68723.1 hypothetical protein GETHPA_02560 [Geothrix rubra]
MDHEAEFTRAFLASAKRARFIQALAQPKHRGEALAQLDEDLPYMPGFATEVPSAQDFPAELEKLLRAKGAGPTCHVMALELKADGRELPLREALDQICLQGSGAILSCLPGQLAYYRPAAPGRGILFERHRP